MRISNKKEHFILLAGDLFFFVSALWITLGIRYFEIPTGLIFYNHLIPFSFLFLVWVLVFASAGLYAKHTAIFQRQLPSIILYAQIVNIIIAALFFFFIPYFGITPKTNLFIYLAISFVLITLWRLYVHPHLHFRKVQGVIIIGHSEEVKEIVVELGENRRYSLSPRLIVNLDEEPDFKKLHAEASRLIESGEVQLIIADTKSDNAKELLSLFYNLTFLETKVLFIDIHNVYEEMFDRVPMSALNERWVLGNISLGPQRLVYTISKRSMDILGALILGLVSLVLLPFVFIFLKLQDGGPIFIRQERIGRRGKPIFVYKFRTMSFNDTGDAWVAEKGKNKVTTVGAFLRKSSIDEFPQFVNIIKGELSLIGPRSDIIGIHTRLSSELSQNGLRYMVTPGISGWAQIKQQYEEGHVNPQSVSEMKTRLSYDLFYIKNRSFFLDVIIAVRTLKALFSGRAGV